MGYYDLSFIAKFEIIFPKYIITVYDKLGDYKSFAYRSSKIADKNSKHINIFYDKRNNHYFLIRNLKSFFNYRHECTVCETLYNHDHKCPLKCKFCDREPPCSFSKTLIKCKDCNRHFRGMECYDHHKIKKNV